jgi:hypothetical protein
MADRAGLDDGRRAVGEALDGGQRGRQLVVGGVVGGVSGMQLRTSGSPVRWRWASIRPGVTTQPVASSTVAAG